jgi:hypothetical protein
MQTSVFGHSAELRTCTDRERGPVVLSYGVGVDSTALLIELVSRGQAPDLVLTADPGAEKPATYAFCGCRPMCKRVLIECARDRVRSSVRPSYAAFSEAAGQYGDLRIGSKSTGRALTLTGVPWFS